MSRFRPIIHVFVSSRFDDLKADKVFLSLEHYFLPCGFQFQVIDLSWDLPGKAERDHRTTQILFDELGRVFDPGGLSANF